MFNRSQLIMWFVTIPHNTVFQCSMVRVTYASHSHTNCVVSDRLICFCFLSKKNGRCLFINTYHATTKIL
uniref:Uncharacterized protein n=1 Tax=Pararge aegeria TaxID=116150 RepID=S4P768_9NEOP